MKDVQKDIANITKALNAAEKNLLTAKKEMASMIKGKRAVHRSTGDDLSYEFSRIIRDLDNVFYNLEDQVSNDFAYWSQLL